jgi:putative DNA primase/helicase
MPEIGATSKPLVAPDTGALDKFTALDGFYLTELGNAERLHHTYGQDLKWVAGASYASTGNFYIWNDSRWVLDESARVLSMAQDVIRNLRQMIIDALNGGWTADETEPLLKFWNRSEHESMGHNMIMLLRPMIAIKESEFDADPMLLCVKNGVLNLKDGTFRCPKREDLLTKQTGCNYDPSATAPVWEQFLKETCNSDEELIRYLRQCAGLCLTGLVEEHLFFIIVGRAGTGKSTFQEALKYVWGDYCIGIDPNSLATAGKAEGGKARPDIAKLRGARLVFANESRAGLRLDEGLVKSLTGGDTMTARELYQKEFDFVPQFKLWLRTNNAPVFDGADTGMQRRIQRVPFDTICLNKDPKLANKLKAEADGILNWALIGFQDYQTNGIVVPQVVKDSTKEYIKGLDSIGLFLAERCELKGSHTQAAGELYQQYRNWVEDQGGHPVAVVRFKEQMETRGFTHQSIHGCKRWVGLKLVGANSWKQHATVVPDQEYQEHAAIG